jgi:hypothetical protein
LSYSFHFHHHHHLRPGSEPVADGFADACLARGLPPTVRDVLPLLGTAVGLDDVAKSEFMVDKVVTRSFHALIDGVCHPNMNCQSALLLLRMSGVPRSNYWARTLAARVTEVALQQTDEMIASSAIYKLGLSSTGDVAPSIRVQLTLPIRSGGLGLVRVADNAHASYLASLLLAAPFVSKVLIDHDAGYSPQLVHASGSFQFLVEQGVPHGPSHALKDDFSATWMHYSAGAVGVKLQQLLTQELLAVRRSEWLRRLAPVDRARVLSAGTFQAGRWLTVFPCFPEFFISNHHYRFAVRHLLGLHPVPIDDLRLLPVLRDGRQVRVCRCGADLQADANHFFVCPMQHKLGHNRRHDHLRDSIISLATSTGFRADKEPLLHQIAPPNRQFIGDFPAGRVPGLRLDALITDGISRYGVDVSVTSSSSASNVVRSGHQALSAAHARERDKMRKYNDECQRRGLSFVPFVMESNGGFGPLAVQFLQRLGLLAAERGACTVQEFADYAFRCLSVALQVGNGLCVESALKSLHIPLAAPLVPVESAVASSAAMDLA